MKIVGAMMVVLTGAALLGWHDALHFAVGVPVVLVLALIWRLCGMRARPAEDLDQGEEGEEDGAGRRFLGGAAAGLACMACLGLAFAGAERSPWHPKDCPEVLLKLRILQEARAHESILQLADAHTGRKISCACRAGILDYKVRALWGVAGQGAGAVRLERLRQAVGVARESGQSDLVLLAESRLREAEQQGQIENQRLELTAQRAETARQRDLIEQQTQQIKHQQVEIANLSHRLAELQRRQPAGL